MSGWAGDVAVALVDAGVKTAFGVPGSGDSLALVTALAARGVPFVGTAHEGAGAIMAGAFARQSGSLGCALSIKGPGLANMIPGLLVARYEGWPLVGISEAYAPSAPASRMHKRLDQAAATQAFVKAHATLGEPSSTVRQLSAAARDEVPGPVHLDLFAPSGAGAWHAAAAHAPTPSATLDEIRRALDAARRPIVIAGSLATRREWGARLASLRVPVLTTVAAKGVVDESADHAAGVFTGDGGPLAPETALLAEADLVVGLGLRAGEILGVRPFAAPLLLLDVTPTAGLEGWRPAILSVDTPAETFDDVLARLDVMSWGRERIGEARAALQRRLASEEWLPGALFTAVARNAPDVRLVVDTGLFCTVAEHAWPARRWRDFLGSANGRYMGTALPMALGALLADASRPVACVVGDGGWGYAAELRLAFARRLPLLLIFVSDGRYGSLAAAPSARGANAEALTLPARTWLRVVEGMGGPARAVASTGELDAAIGAWKPDEGPLFLEAAFDPARYAAMTEGLR